MAGFLYFWGILFTFVVIISPSPPSSISFLLLSLLLADAVSVLNHQFLSRPVMRPFALIFIVSTQSVSIGSGVSFGRFLLSSFFLPLFSLRYYLSPFHLVQYRSMIMMDGSLGLVEVDPKLSCVLGQKCHEIYVLYDPVPTYGRLAIGSRISLIFSNSTRIPSLPRPPGQQCARSTYNVYLGIEPWRSVYHTRAVRAGPYIFVHQDVSRL